MTQTTPNKQSMTPYEMAALAANLADDKKAQDIRMLDTANVSFLSDYFVICSTESKAQTRALSDEIESAFKKRGIMPLGISKDGDAKWCLLDYGDIVIHVMHKQERQYYQLEHFWNHASEIHQNEWLKRQAS
ncbi:MAG: ribosome silencing factor [Vampirovibrionales bacterium]|nr:ribosome silencing factor [Vampirovibrionales bacterium]